ncbi:MAG: hypothetical protein ACLFQ5_03370 [Oceanicaulis sp.]
MTGAVSLLSAAALSAGLAGVTGAVLRAVMRRGPAEPARFDPPAPAGLVARLGLPGLRPGDFSSSQTQGDFGELLTSLAMAARGWRMINGKVGGPQGVDGIFVRDGARGLEAVMIETKTGSSAYAEKSMSDKKLLGDLDTLYLTAPDSVHQAVYEALSAGLRSGSSRIVKELWRHRLDTGRTQAVALGRNGERLGKGRLMDLRLLSAALAAGLRDLDRGGAYLSRS